MRTKRIRPGAQCWGLVFCILAAFYAGCTTMPKVSTLTLAEQPDCVTSLEGYYRCDDSWTEGSPALVLETTGTRRSRGSKNKQTTHKVVVGRIVSRDDNGVTFSTGEAGDSRDSNAIYYPYEDIVALIDDDGKAVYGEIPVEYSSAQSMELWIALGTQYYGDSPTHRLVLQPNKPFSYCLPGGTYDVKAVFFKDGRGNISRGVEYPELTITLTRGSANYIGDICISLPKTALAESLYVPMGFVIPCESLSGSASSGLGLFGGVVGGAIGGAIVGGAIAGAVVASSNGSGEKIGEKKALIAIDKNFQPRCKSDLRQNIIEVKK